MSFNFNQLPEEIVVGLINRDNGCSLLAKDLTFGLPAIIPGNKNTSLTVTAKPGAPIRGSVQMTYNRISLAFFDTLVTAKIQVEGETTISQLMPKINAACGFELTANDFLDGPLPSFTDAAVGGEKTFTLLASPTSLVYLGSVQVTVKRSAVDLNTIITVTVLSDIAYA